MTVIANVFPKLYIVKNVVKKMSKSRISEDPSTSNMVNGIKQCWNLNDTSFTIFIDYYERN